ncbi:MAG: division/cell wall cluster transcriptional repressor MraZ [Dehalococcoidia bacterium]
MTTFFGSFEHAIDERGRVAIPARYRKSFDEGVVLRLGSEGCIEMYTAEGFERQVSLRLGDHESNRSRAGRRVRRGFLAQAYDVELDRQGRILIPQQLREPAALSDRAVVVGLGDYIELWDPARWETELDEVGDDDDEEGAAGSGAVGGDA